VDLLAKIDDGNIPSLEQEGWGTTDTKYVYKMFHQ